MENTNIVQNVSLVTIDHYMSSPADGFDTLYSEFWGTQILKVPVLRVFGCTPNGNYKDNVFKKWKIYAYTAYSLFWFILDIIIF